MKRYNSGFFGCLIMIVVMISSGIIFPYIMYKFPIIGIIITVGIIFLSVISYKLDKDDRP